jgi:hypothetical protein
VVLPGGLVTSTTTFTYTQIISPTQATDGFAFAGRSFTMVATDATGRPVTTFADRFTITLNYQDSDWQTAGIPVEENLNLYYWDGAKWGAMLPCSGCALNMVGNHLTVVLEHLTEFALLGNPLDAPAISVYKVTGSIELRWTQTQAGIIRYEVYRSTSPYFIPGEDDSTNLNDVMPPGVGQSVNTVDSQAVGPPPFGYFYAVVAVGDDDLRSPASNHVGVFYFSVEPGAISR